MYGHLHTGSNVVFVFVSLTRSSRGFARFRVIHIELYKDCSFRVVDTEFERICAIPCHSHRAVQKLRVFVSLTRSSRGFARFRIVSDRFRQDGKSSSTADSRSPKLQYCCAPSTKRQACVAQ